MEQRKNAHNAGERLGQVQAIRHKDDQVRCQFYSHFIFKAMKSAIKAFTIATLLAAAIAACSCTTVKSRTSIGGPCPMNKNFVGY